jgi:hypothetical protein
MGNCYAHHILELMIESTLQQYLTTSEPIDRSFSPIQLVLGMLPTTDLCRSKARPQTAFSRACHLASILPWSYQCDEDKIGPNMRRLHLSLLFGLLEYENILRCIEHPIAFNERSSVCELSLAHLSQSLLVLLI